MAEKFWEKDCRAGARARAFGGGGRPSARPAPLPFQASVEPSIVALAWPGRRHPALARADCRAGAHAGGSGQGAGAPVHRARENKRGGRGRKREARAAHLQESRDRTDDAARYRGREPALVVDEGDCAAAG